MQEIEVTAGVIEYEDTGGSGPVVVLLHGLAMSSTVWRNVVDDLRRDHRCVVPTLPLGAHRRPMDPTADLSLAGQARIVEELLGGLDLRDVTLVQNDIGISHLAVGQSRKRIARLVLASTEAFDNYPPGLPGKAAAIAAKVPGGVYAVAQSLRFRVMRRSPLAFGWMAKRPIPDEIMDDWFRPIIEKPENRRDVAKYARLARKPVMEAATRELLKFDGPVLVAWAADDRVMPPEHGRRLARMLPDARWLEIPDSYTLIPEDQPGELARAIRDFAANTPGQPIATSPLAAGQDAAADRPR